MKKRRIMIKKNCSRKAIKIPSGIKSAMPGTSKTNARSKNSKNTISYNFRPGGLSAGRHNIITVRWWARRKQLCSHKRLATNLAYLTWYQTGCQTRYYPWIWGMESIHGSYPSIIAMETINGWYPWIVSMDNIHEWYPWIVPMGPQGGTKIP